MKSVAGTGSKRGRGLSLDDKEGFADDLEEMHDGGIIITVTLATPDAIRSTKFNRYYYGGVLKKMCKAADGAVSIDEMHEAMCSRFLSRNVFLVNPKTGEVTEQMVAERSSKLPPDRFEHFVLEVREFGQTFWGITIKDPDPEWRSHPDEDDE